ncbi:MAG: LysM domain-containing protein [Anaerolineae bacterium]|nr:LysM peptidoglycan-binding domain-containing protein [Anaerolineae bacterium]MDW8102914.1 LysM domain-containing protein [Anaerolineae bacterium]
MLLLLDYLVLALLYNMATSTGQPTPTPTRTPKPTFTPGVPLQVLTPSPKPILIHRVSEGEDLSTIASIYNVPEEEILKANGLSDPASIKAGQELIIPINP